MRVRDDLLHENSRLGDIILENSIPPTYVYRPKKAFLGPFHSGWTTSGFSEANGSGLMQGDTLFTSIQHSINKPKPAEEAPVILLLNNYCTWLKNNSERNPTVFDLLTNIKQGFLHAASPKNFISGFAADEIYSLNPIISSDSGFAPAFVTDRPEPQPELGTTDDGNTAVIIQEQNDGNGSEEADEMHRGSLSTEEIYSLNHIISSDSGFAPPFVTDRPEPQPEFGATDDGNTAVIIQEQNDGNGSEEADDMHRGFLSSTSKAAHGGIQLGSESPRSKSTSSSSKSFGSEVVRPFPKSCTALNHRN
ncbi:hypothetical protein JTB14_031812 [Gonioctena quinquepunctata]|nr:hypothetical protein JTB14_031812 [Gonioctena quinquepunctata]